MIDIDYYEAGDVNRITPLYDTYIMADNMDAMFRSMQSYVFAVERQPVIIVGATILWEGIANLVTLPGKLFIPHREETEIELKVILNLWMNANNIRKLYTIINAEYPKHIRWAEKFGFEYEYTMLRASPQGEDLMGYVKKGE